MAKSTQKKSPEEVKKEKRREYNANMTEYQNEAAVVEDRSSKRSFRVTVF